MLSHRRKDHPQWDLGIQERVIPDGFILKLKASFCVQENQKVKNVGFFDICTPFFELLKMRLLLILSATMRLAPRQADCTLIFIHADADFKTFVKLPE